MVDMLDHTILLTRELGTGKSRLEVAYELGLDFEVCPRLAVDHGIEAVRNNLDNCWFDKNKCKYGIDCLRQYRKQFDDRMQTFKNKPLYMTGLHTQQIVLDMVVPLMDQQELTGLNL